MHFARILIDVSQLVLNQWATTPPHKSPQENRFKTKEESFFRLAPVIFWVCVDARRPRFVTDSTISPPETIVLRHLCLRVFDHRPSPHPPVPARLARAHSPPFRPSPSHTGKLQFLSVTPTTLFGTSTRPRSYEAPGPLFTFDLRIKPEHRSVTSSPYSFVQHPAYLCSLCLMTGLTFMELTRGSWIIECAAGSERRGAMFGVQCMWISRVSGYCSRRPGLATVCL